MLIVHRDILTAIFQRDLPGGVWRSYGGDLQNFVLLR